MLESEKLAIAAHLHVLLRRKVGRVTDVEWMVKNADYAREVIRVARADPVHQDLVDWAQRLQDALFQAKPGKPSVGAPVGASDSTLGADSGFVDSRSGTRTPKPEAPRYVGSLR